MSKIESLKDYLSNLYDEDGVCVDPNSLIEKVISCNESDKRKARKEGLQKKIDNGMLEFKEVRSGFHMVIIDEKKMEDLSMQAYYVYGKLQVGLVRDGSCSVKLKTDSYIVNSINKLCKYCKIGKSTGYKAIKELEDKNLIKVEKIGSECDFYINPEYYRFGKYIQPQAQEIFGIVDYKFKNMIE